MVEEGKAYRIDYGNKNPNNKKIYIKTVIDKDRVVFKYWSMRKRSWMYDIKPENFFTLLEESNFIRCVK